MRGFVVSMGLALLTACGDPLGEMPRLSDMDLAEDAPVAEIRAEPDTPGGLFGFLRDRSGGTGDVPDDAPDSQVISLGAELPFGQVARVCDVPERRLGTRVAEYPESGREQYRLYDSAPRSTGPRALYVTGFGDGCARQVTGALALFGAPSLHEQLRYGVPSGTIPYSTTDSAYEQLKSRICRVGKGKPCGERITRLERNTAFLSIYQSFSGSTRWANMLLHDGALVAHDVKTP